MAGLAFYGLLGVLLFLKFIQICYHIYLRREKQRKLGEIIRNT